MKIPFYTAFAEHKKAHDEQHFALNQRFSDVARQGNGNCDHVENLYANIREISDRIERLRGYAKHNDDNFYESIKELKDDIKDLVTCNDCLCETKADNAEISAIKKHVERAPVLNTEVKNLRTYLNDLRNKYNRLVTSHSLSETDVADIRKKHGATLWKLKKSVKGLGDMFQRMGPAEIQIGKNQLAIRANDEGWAELSAVVDGIVIRLENLEAVINYPDP